MREKNTRRDEIPATVLIDLFRRPDRETQALLTDLGLIFLESRAEAAHTKISKRQDRLASMYGTDAQGLGDDELLAVYRQEQDLIRELIVASREKPFVQVAPARLDKIRRDLNQHRQGWTTDSELRTARYQRLIEQNILTNLLQSWHVWLRAVASGKQTVLHHQG